MSSAQEPKERSLITASLVVVSVILPVFSAFALYLRYHARRISNQPFFADDYFIVIAWITSLFLSINIWVFADIIGINHYKHGAASGVTNSLKAIFISSALVNAPLATVKISVLLFYKRIFSIPKFRIAVWISIVIVTCWGFIFFFLVIFELDPVSAAWTGRGTYNFNVASQGYAQVGSSIALDLAVLCVPLPVISTLHMARKRKIAIMLIFWLGAFCCVAAVIRLIFLHEAIRKVIESISNIDIQWKNFIFMVMEPNCSIVAACLPCLGPLFKHGYGPEFLIRSVRSVLSLASNSTRSGSQSVGKSDVPDPHSRHESDATVGSKAAHRDRDADPGQGYNLTEIARSSKTGPGTAENGGIPQGSITVTKAVGWTRD